MFKWIFSSETCEAAGRLYGIDLWLLRNKLLNFCSVTVLQRLNGKSFGVDVDVSKFTAVFIDCLWNARGLRLKQELYSFITCPHHLHNCNIHFWKISIMMSVWKNNESSCTRPALVAVFWSDFCTRLTFFSWTINMLWTCKKTAESDADKHLHFIHFKHTHVCIFYTDI